MAKALNYVTKEKLVKLAGTCFWYWNSFYSFLDSCNIPVSLYKSYPQGAYNKYDVMRNILTYLEQHGQYEKITKIISELYRLDNAVDDVPDPVKAKELLSDFKKHVGSDPIEAEIQKRQVEVKQQEYKDKIDYQNKKKELLKEIYDKFIELLTSDISAQQKGFELEKIFYELLLLEEFEYSPPYRTDIEQIDGVFRLDKFDYLVEMKYVQGPIKKSDLSIFDGKIRNKAQSTRGFFLAMEGFDLEHIRDFMGNSPRLILMDGQEFTMVLEGRKSLYDTIRRKVDELVKSGQIFFKIQY